MVAGVAAVLVIGVAAIGAIIALGADGDTEAETPLVAEEPDPPEQEPDAVDAGDEESAPAEVTDPDPVEEFGRFADEGTVTILHPNTSAPDVEAIQAMLTAFTQEYPGIEVIEQGSPDFNAIARSRIEAGNAPDVLFHPQPTLMRDLWDQRLLRPLDGIVDAPALAEQTIPGLVDTMTFDDRLAGVPLRVAPKSLVWYSPRTFDAGGYQVPETWDELLALSRAMADDDVVAAPWCIGIESADVTGWVATDWIEDLVLRAEGLEAYDDWTTGDLPFDPPQIRGTIERYLEPIWFDDDLVLGGTGRITQESFDATTYRCPVDRQAHDLVSRSTVYRFDASDQMPSAVGAGSFWTEITNWISGDQDLRSTLAAIDRTFDEVR